MPREWRWKKRYFALAALLALLLPRCGGPRSLVIEGTVAPNLKLNGSVVLAATADLFLCKGFLLQSPTGHSERSEMVFTRLPNGRYRLSADLTDLTYGGLCRWCVLPVGIGATDVRDEYKHYAVLYLNSSGGAEPHSRAVTGKSVCYPLGHTPTATHMRCDTRS